MAGTPDDLGDLGDFEEIPEQPAMADVGDFEEIPGANFSPAPASQPSYLPAIEVPELSYESNSSLGQGAKPVLPQAQVPFAPVFEAARKFKEAHIAPVVRFWQSNARAAYLGGEDPGFENPNFRERASWGSQDPNAPGQILRDKAPFLASLTEGLGGLALGETSFNTSDESKATQLDPRARKVQEGMRSASEAAFKASASGKILAKLAPAYADQANALAGDVGAAGIQSALEGFSNLPLFLIPGLGRNPVLQGATGGFASGMIDPKGDPESGLIGGGVAGGVVGGVLKGASKLTQWRANRGKVTVPVAIIPPDEVGNFADQTFRMENAPIPVKNAADDAAALVVGHGDDGLPVTKAVSIGDQGVQVQTVAGRARRPNQVVLATPEVREAAVREPEGPEAQSIWQEWKGPGTQPMVLNPDVQFNPDDLAEMAAESYGNLPDVMDGLVVAIEGKGGDGTARIHSVSSPKLQIEILKAREIAEVTRADGTKVIGFPASPDGEKWGLVRPDVEEGIPGAATQDFVLGPDDSLRILEHGEIKNLVNRRAYELQEAKEAAAVAQADAQVRAEDVALGGNGDGRMLPPPPPPGDIGPPAPPPKPTQVQKTDVIKNSWLQKALQVGRRNLVPPGVREKLHLADAATDMFSVDTFRRYALDSLKSLNKVAPEISQMPVKDWTDAAGKSHYGQASVLGDIQRFVTGDLTVDQLTQIHPTLSKALHERMEIERQTTRAMESRIVDLGMMEPGTSLETLDGLSLEAGLEAYSTRIHLANLLPDGEWAKLAKRDTAGHKSIVDDIRREFYESPKYKGFTAAAKQKLAEKHFDFLAGVPDPKEWFTSPKLRAASKDALNSLKARSDLRPFELAAKGEVLNPFVRVAETRARQAQLILQGEVWADVAANPQMARPGELLTPEEIASGDWIPGDETQSMRYGKAKGMWINREVHDALVDIPLMQKNADSFLRGVIGTIKWNRTVGNPGRWAKNALESIQGIMLSNLGNPFTRPYHFGTGLSTYRKDYLAHMKAPGVDTRLLPRAEAGNTTRAELEASNVARMRFKRMIEGGVIGSELTAPEFGLQAKELMSMIAEAEHLTPGKVNFLDIWKGAINAKNKPLDAMSKAYGAMDPAAKYATAVVGLKTNGIDLETGMLKDKAKAIAFIRGAKRYRAGMDNAAIVDQVEKEVFRRVALSYPMMDRVAPAATAATKLGDAGLASMFMKMKFESNRVYAQLPNRVLNEPGMKGNLAAYAALVGSMGIGGLATARKLAGVRQEDIDAAYASAPKSTQVFHPNTMWGWNRDPETGRLLGVDLSFMLQPLSWSGGDDPNANVGVNALRRVAGFTVGGTPYEPAMMSLLAENGLAGEQYMSPNTPAYLQDSARLVGKALESFGPAGATSLYRAAVQTGTGFNPNGGKFVPRSPVDAMTAVGNVLIPGTFHESGGTADMQRTLQEAEAAYRQAKRERVQAQHKNEGQSTGNMTLPLNREVAIQKAIEHEQKAAERLKQLKATFAKTRNAP